MNNVFLFLSTIQAQVSNDVNWSSNFKMLGQFFFLVIIFIIIIFMAIYVTKIIAGTKLIRTKNANITLVESMSIGFQNVIHLVKVGDKYFLIGTSKVGICYLTEIDPDSVNLKKFSNYDKVELSFENQFNKLISKLLKDKKYETKDLNDQSDERTQKK